MVTTGSFGGDGGIWDSVSLLEGCGFERSTLTNATVIKRSWPTYFAAFIVGLGCDSSSSGVTNLSGIESPRGRLEAA